MTVESKNECKFQALDPFGLLITSEREGVDIRTIGVQTLKDYVERHRVVVLRRFASLEGAALPEFGKTLGSVLDWSFGAVNDLRVHDDPKNYLFTNHAVPFHWDGAFVGKIPHYIVFECEIGPHRGDGGETLFCDTTRVLQNSSQDRRDLWSRITVTYSTERLAHYGGTFSSPIISSHPVTGERVMRFAEPVEDLNPVHLDIAGIPPEEKQDFLKDMHGRLNDAGNCYCHEWMMGDIVIADNHALLHGRNAFADGAQRHIRRVNVM
jgi:alpha-ketoglutarate-dependent taurine dioxygenase